MHSVGGAGDVGSMPVLDRHLKLVPLSQNEVRANWDYVSGHIKKILRKTREKWLPEDVYSSLMSGDSACLVVYSGGERKGVLVVKKYADDWTGEAYIFVWCVSLDSGVFDETLAELRKFAAAAGIKSIRGDSPRLGWAKKVKLIRATYEVEA